MGRVAITGAGLVTPLGCSAQEIAGAISAGGCHAGDEMSCDIPLHAIPPEKRGRIGRLDRLCRLFLAASYLAVDDAELSITAENEERTGLAFGTGLGCLLTNAEYYDKIVEQGVSAASPRLFAYTVSSAAAGEVSIALGIKGPNATHHLGFAAGLGALGYGFDQIESGRADIVLAGGADAGGPLIGAALRDMGLLKGPHQSRPFHDSTPGVWPSEGAAVFVLEDDELARRRGASVLGHVAGYAAGFEPTLASAAPAATGVTETMRRALAHSGIAAGDVDLVVSSAHGTPADEAERAAIREVLGDGPLVLAPKAIFGEMFAASALLGVAWGLGTGGWRFSPSPQPPAPSPFLFDATLHPPMHPDRLRSVSVVMVNALCYSGNVVSLIFTRRE